MYSRRLKCRDKKWNLLFQLSKSIINSNTRGYACSRTLSYTTTGGNCTSYSGIVRRYQSNAFRTRSISEVIGQTSLYGRSIANVRNRTIRFYSSKGDGNNADEKHAPVEDISNSEKGNIGKKGAILHSDRHAQLGIEEQKEWLHNEKLAIDSKKKESPFLTRRQKFRNEFLRRIVPWEKITLSWETFPYYIHDHAKNLLVECVASHLKHKKFTTTYGARLPSSSGRILLQSVPGSELYRERVVRSLARDLHVPLLVLDSSVLAPYDFGYHGMMSETESDDDNGEEGISESESDDENDACNEEDWTSSSDVKSECSDNDEDVQVTAEDALKKLAAFKLEDFAKRVVNEAEAEAESESPKAGDEPSDQTKRVLKKGDRVKYIGPSVCLEADNRIILGKIPTSDGPTNAYTVIRGRTLATGQCGEVYEVNEESVAVILENCDSRVEGEKDEKLKKEAETTSVYWFPVNDIEYDAANQVEECYIALEALCEVLQSTQPLIVYLPDSSLWLSRAVPKEKRKDFLRYMQEMFDELVGPVVLICGQNKAETGSKEKEKFTMILPNLGRLAKLPLPLKQLTEGLQTSKRSEDTGIYKLFTNVMCVYPPKEEDPLRTFNKQLEEDRRIVISRSNINELHKVLEEHELSCMDLLHVNTDGVVLTRQKAEKVVGWAKNHYLSSCLVPSIKGERLHVPRESIEIALSRLKEQELISKKPSQNLKELAKDEYETNFVSAVVPPGEIGIKFDDVGALEEVKKALNELVILPMRRPELFSRGNLLRPCKGILLFGPPGTGKTLLAKALATEAGANFISITGSTLTSKWFGDAEKLTKALFSFASKLAPVIVFVDEIDSLLGARGGASEHEATRRMRNEFMAAWDGLRSKDSQKILILGATNRPFDLDDAVIRRLPRRILVDLPDAGNRIKILRIFLAQETLESDFSFEKLANATEGYSGSDLKNLCIAAAYRPVQELLDEEKKEGRSGIMSALRPLKLDDFIESKAKVGASVAFDATSMNELRKWNEQYGEGGSRQISPFGF